jgi:hypothetical protein
VRQRETYVCVRRWEGEAWRCVLGVHAALGQTEHVKE